MNKAVNAGLADAKFRARLADLGGMMIGGSAADFGDFLVHETDKWAKVIHEANIKLID